MVIAQTHGATERHDAYAMILQTFRIDGDPMVTGPTVLANIVADAEVDAAGSGYARAQLSLYRSNRDVPELLIFAQSYSFGLPLGPPGGEPGVRAVHLDQPYEFELGVEYSFYQYVDAHVNLSEFVASSGGVAGGYAEARLDPNIVFDPLTAAHYRIYGGLFGPPIPSLATVPEPASWVLLIGGFGLVGGVNRRRARLA